MAFVPELPVKERKTYGEGNGLDIKRILIADDDLDQCYLFRLILNSIDPSIELHQVHTGDELLDYLDYNSVDLLFLDLHMPCKTGFLCIQEIRTDPRGKLLPIIVYSNSTNQRDIQTVYSLGADLYVVKPFSSTHLRNALHCILQMRWTNSPHKLYFINNNFVPVTNFI